MSLRHLLVGPVFAGVFLGGGEVRAQAGRFLTKAEALAKAFPQAVRAWEWRRMLGDAEKKRLEKRLRRRLAEGGYYVFLLDDGAGPCGLAVLTAEIGKTEYFTFVVGLGLDRRVCALHVLDYKESRGGEVRRRGFREQFLGRDLGKRFRLRREIESIPGATLSALAVTRGVRKVLHVVDEWFRGMDEKDLAAAFARHGKRLRLPARVGAMHRFSFPSMGTVCSLVLEGVDARVAARVRNAVRRSMAKTEKQLSNWSDDSEISRVLAERPHKRPVRLSKDVFEVLSRAMAASDESNGAFDPTIYPALKRAHKGRGSGPSRPLRNLVGHSKVTLDPTVYTMRFDVDGVGISTDAFAKGVAVDRAVKILKARGVKRGRVGFRSTFYLLGADHKVPLPDGRVLSLGDCAVGAASAGDRAEAILDPRTLAPVEFAGTVIVVAADGFQADWLATAGVVLGRKKTIEVLQRDGRRFFFMPPTKSP